MNKRYRDRRQDASHVIRRGPLSPASEALSFPRRRKTFPGLAKALAARFCVIFLPAVHQLTRQFSKRRRRRQLQLVEIQQLGDKRFVAIVRFGKQKFLIGGAAASVSLLAEIHTQRATVIAPRPLGPESA